MKQADSFSNVNVRIVITRTAEDSNEYAECSLDLQTLSSIINSYRASNNAQYERLAEIMRFAIRDTKTDRSRA